MGSKRRGTGKFEYRPDDPLEVIRGANGWDPEELSDWRKGLRDEPPAYVANLEKLALEPTVLHAQDERRAREEAERAVETAREAKAAGKTLLEVYGRGDDLRGVLTRGKAKPLDLPSREAAPLAVLGRTARRPVPVLELARRARTLLGVEFASGSRDEASIRNGVNVALNSLRKRSPLADKLLPTGNRSGVQLAHDLVVVLHGDEK